MFLDTLNDVRAYIVWSWKTTLITWIFLRGWYPPWNTSGPPPGHLYVNCAFYLDKIWYFYVNKRKLRHFKIYHLYFTPRYQLGPCGRTVSSLLPNNSFSLPETHGLNPTTAKETILLFILHGCISIHQISNSRNFLKYFAVSRLKPALRPIFNVSHNMIA